MKILIATLILGASLPGNAYERFGDHSIRDAYEAQKGYAYENKCFRYEYKEQYVPGNSISPGYVKSYNEKVSIPCNNIKSKVFNHNYHEPKPSTSYIEYKSAPKCTSSTMLGGLIGGGIAATLSKNDAYGWSIPLGVVLGAGIGNAEC